MRSLSIGTLVGELVGSSPNTWIEYICVAPETDSTAQLFDLVSHECGELPSATLEFCELNDLWATSSARSSERFEVTLTSVEEFGERCLAFDS